MNDQIAEIITQTINGCYDLIDSIFNFNDKVDFAFKDVFIPMVVKSVTDLTDDGQLDSNTVSTILNTAYDAVDGEFNLDMKLDFGFKAVLVPVLVPLITGGINNLLKNANNR